MKILMRLKINFHFSFFSSKKVKNEIKNHKNGENKKASILERIKNIFKYIDSIDVELLIFVLNQKNWKKYENVRICFWN